MEQRERLAIAFACGLGALVGSLIMLEWEANPIMTTLGALTGSVMGYLFYRPREVCSTVWSVLCLIIDIKEIGKFLIFVCAFLYLIVGIITTIRWADLSLSPNSTQDSIVQMLVVFHCMLVGAGSICFAVFSAEDYQKNPSTSKLARTVVIVLASGILASPIGFVVIWTTLVVCLAVGIPVGIAYLAYHYTTRVFRGLLWFTKAVLIGIYSDQRLMCLIGAGTGSVIGYLAGSAIVGFCAGAAIGLLNYELVSKRILKFVPVPK